MSVLTGAEAAPVPPGSSVTVLGFVEHMVNASSFACRGVLAGGLQGWYLQREKPVTITWEGLQPAAAEKLMLELATPAGARCNVTTTPVEWSLNRYTYSVPSSAVIANEGPWILTSPGGAMGSLSNVFLSNDIGSCQTTAANDAAGVPNYVGPVTAAAAVVIVGMGSLVWFKRHRRVMRSKRKGKASESGRDSQQMQEKGTKIQEWMAKAVKKGPKKSRDPQTGSEVSDSGSTEYGGSNKSVYSDGPLLSSSGTLEDLKSASGTPTKSRSSSSSQSNLETPVPKTSVRTYTGPPPRFAGGSSTWRPPREAGILCKAVFSHKPEQADEMNLRRGDFVVVDAFFEDGWTLVHSQDPLKFKFKKGKEKAGVDTRKWLPKAKLKTNDHEDLKKEGRDQNSSGMVPWHCLTLATEQDVRQLAKTVSEVSVNSGVTGNYAMSHRL
ncbi:hypothetical protein SpCBS45565_g05633 [Spizellomyces sp. 'palustris']|nr:hypothetical protein SpCBS45565_g05633 [Spizellomyces sp. 'palustris']